MDISKINPYIRVAMRSILRADKVIKRRIIYDYELIYIDDGEFIFNYNGVDHLCQTGDFIFIRPNIPHSFFGINRDLSQPHIHFDMTHLDDSPVVPVSFKDLPDLTDREKAMIRDDCFPTFPQTPLVKFSDKEYVLRLFYEIVDSEALYSLQQKANLILIIEQLIADNFQSNLKQIVSPYPIESQVKDYIDAGQGTSSRLDDIAKQFNYSKYYLDRRFHNKYGISIIAYRNQKRMQTARELLKNESVSAVCEKTGFSSIFVFSRAFKNCFGISPSDYKKRSEKELP